MTDPILPGLHDDDLSETLDMIGTVLASVSDRVDAQTGTVNRLVKTTTEARQAAFAARAQTNPKKYGDLVGKTIQGRITECLDEMRDFGIQLGQQTRITEDVLRKAEEDKWETLRQVRERETAADRLKQRLPWFALGALALALILTVALPRFMASTNATCVILGAEWTRTTSGVEACVFYGK